MSITFAVSAVDPPARRMASIVRASAIPRLVGAGERNPAQLRLAQAYVSDARLVAATDVNAFAQAAHDAFYGHHPLVISPDAIWFCLAQGFAQHVNLHAEELRHRFVKHEGKAKIVVERPDFFLGQPNPWPEVFAAFSEGIAAHVGKLRDLVVADFSTTGTLERAASEVVLMDAFQAYFEYVVMAGCGIPSITLLGTPDDWRSVRRRASTLSEYGLEGWTKALLPVLDRIVETSEGRVDVDFWRSFFRYQSGSGPSELTGWIVTLFPYLDLWDGTADRRTANPYLRSWEQAYRKAEARKSRIATPEGPPLCAITASIASAPVKLIDARDRSEHPLRFVAGMFGVVQTHDGALAPEFGWAIVHEPAAAG